MGAPQIILLLLYGLSLGISLVRHGKPKEGTENVGVTIISLSIVMGLLWWGGFFHA